MALFNRSVRPNNTSEEWGVITRYGLFAHGGKSNPFVGPATYMCHSGIDSDEKYNVMVGNYQVWMLDQVQSVTFSNRSVLSQTLQIKDLLKHIENGLKPSDMERSMNYPGSICSPRNRSFNVTSTEHTQDTINHITRKVAASDRKPRKGKMKNRNKSIPTSEQSVNGAGKSISSEKLKSISSTLCSPTSHNTKRRKKELFFLPEDQEETKVNRYQDQTILKGLYTSSSPKNAQNVESASPKHKKKDSPVAEPELEPEPGCSTKRECSNTNIPSIKASIDNLEKELMESLVSLKIHKGEQEKTGRGNKQLENAIKDAKQAAMTCDMAEKTLQRSNVRKEKEDIIGALLQESLESYRNLIRDRNEAESLNLDITLQSPRLEKEKKTTKRNSYRAKNRSRSYTKKESPKSRSQDKKVIMEEIERLNEELNDFKPNKSCFSVHSQSSLADNESETDTDWSSIVEESKSLDESLESLKASIRKCSRRTKPEYYKPRNPVVNAVREIMEELEYQ